MPDTTNDLDIPEEIKAKETQADAALEAANRNANESAATVIEAVKENILAVVACNALRFGNTDNNAATVEMINEENWKEITISITKDHATQKKAVNVLAIIAAE